MAELTQNEKRLLAALVTAPANIPVERLAEKLGATEPATLQWGFLAESKGYATVSRTPQEHYKLTEEGKTYALSGLPERHSSQGSGRRSRWQISRSIRSRGSGSGRCGEKGGSRSREGM